MSSTYRNDGSPTAPGNGAPEPSPLDLELQAIKEIEMRGGYTDLGGLDPRERRNGNGHAPSAAEIATETAGTVVLGAADIFAPLPPVNWLCEALDVAPGAPILVAGYGFSGKTVAAQDLALAVATGTPAWDRFPVRRGRVLHIDYEQGSYLTRLRYQRLARARGIDPAALAGQLALAALPGWYLDGDLHDELTRLCDGIDLLIVDSFRAACPNTDENTSEARIPLDHLTRVAERTGVTPVVIHHARKPSQGDRGGTRMAIRGSGALYDACGSVLVFQAEKGAPVTVSHDKARISGCTASDFQLHITDVDVDGDPRGGLRVKHTEAPKQEAKTAPADRVEEAQQLVLGLLRGEGSFKGGKKAFALRLGRDSDAVGDALTLLRQRGAVSKGGTYHEPVWTIIVKDDGDSA